MIQLLLLLLPCFASFARANFALVFGVPSSGCRACLQSIYSNCASSYNYNEGLSSDFSNCICSPTSTGEAAVCLTGACFDITQNIHVIMYMGWCIEYNAASRAEACSSTGVTREYIEQNFGDAFIEVCNREVDESDSGSGSRGELDGPSGDAGGGNSGDGAGQAPDNGDGTLKGSDRTPGDSSRGDSSPGDSSPGRDGDRDSSSTGRLGKMVVPGLVWTGLLAALVI